MVKNQKGQAITEAVLIMVVFLGVTFLVANYFKDEEIVAGLIKKPWQSISGMIQNGVWEEPTAGGPKHPSTYMRHVSLEGEAP